MTNAGDEYQNWCRNEGKALFMIWDSIARTGVKFEDLPALEAAAWIFMAGRELAQKKTAEYAVDMASGR